MEPHDPQLNRMMNWALGLFIAFILLLATASIAHAAVTPRQVAVHLVRDYIAPLTSPDTRRVRVTGFPCRPAPERWVSCRVRAEGAVTCRAIVRVVIDGKHWKAWIPRMYCIREGR